MPPQIKEMVTLTKMYLMDLITRERILIIDNMFEKVNVHGFHLEPNIISGAVLETPIELFGAPNDRPLQRGVHYISPKETFSTDGWFTKDMYLRLWYQWIGIRPMTVYRQ